MSEPEKLSRGQRRRRNKRLREIDERAAADPISNYSVTTQSSVDAAYAENGPSEAEQAAKVFTDKAIKGRHKPVLDWVCNAHGITHAQFIEQILRAAVVRESAGYREATGGGGSTSKNIEVLAEKLVPR